MLHDAREFIKPCVKQIVSKFGWSESILTKNTNENPPWNAKLHLPPSTKNKSAALVFNEFTEFPPDSSMRFVQIFPDPDFEGSDPPGDPLTSPVDGSRFAVQHLVKGFVANLSGRATPYLFRAHAVPAQDTMLGVYIFVVEMLVLCNMTICCLFEDYMFESSFENVIIRNRQHMSHVTCFVL